LITADLVDEARRTRHDPRKLGRVVVALVRAGGRGKRTAA
jgi:hypothetical protein